MGVGIALGVAGAAAAAGSMASANQAAQSGAGPGKTGRTTLTAYGQTTPYQYDLNQQWNNQFNALGTQDLNSLLFGTEASSGQNVLPFWARNTTGAKVAWQNPQTGEISYTKQKGWERVATQDWSKQATGGLMDVIGNASQKFSQMGIDSANAGRAADLAALQQFQPGYQAQFEQAAPELMALRRQMGTDASQQLALGSRLAPEDAYRISQGVRGSFANRGLGNSNPAQLEEALQLFGGGEALRNQRESYAGSTANLLAQTQPDYTKFILGQQGALPGAMNFLQSQQPLTYQRNYDPFNTTAAQATQNNAQTQANGYNSQASTLGGLSGGLFSVAGDMYKPKA